MMTKKVRTEYMKKFREPKWETFSKCYEDSLKYRLTRRVMEHSHKPWFWEGGSVRSSGKSTPRTVGSRLGRNRVAPPPAAETNRPRSGPDAGPSSEEQEVTEAADADAAYLAENTAGGAPNASVASHEPDADDGPVTNGDPAESASSPLRHRDGRPGNGSPTDRKPERAESQPPPGGGGDEAAAPNDQGERCDASVRTPPSRPPDQRLASAHRRRARSADPDELRRRRWTASATADERWVTEYMRCFSARVDARPRL
ncbi:centriole, cilia and spindle-associated protein-like [Hippocampus zosterae]|uniref:centriole, cilia and spindle-associated protein-like n=1 Tax=Hippocampus zosterae TaxID=109293 RepID=UPI00223CFC5D|nr:centriole, cilia and spindle-associated protein-like [Hippocampus zosterae]